MLGASWVCPAGRPMGRPRTRMDFFISWLPCEHPNVPLDNPEELAEQMELCVSLFRLMPPQPDPGKAQENSVQLKVVVDCRKNAAKLYLKHSHLQANSAKSLAD